MKSFQDRLFKDFDAKKVTGKDGKTRRVYTYVGDYAAWTLTPDELDRYKHLYIGGGIVLIFLYIWKGIVSFPINSYQYLGGANLISLVPLMALVMGLYSFIRAKKEMYLRDCKQMKGLILWGAILYLIFQAAAFVLCVVYMVLEGVSLWSVVITAATLLSAFLALVIYAAQLKVKYIEIPGKGRPKDA